MVTSVKQEWPRISICGSMHEYPDWLFTTGSCTIMTGAPGNNYCMNVYTYEVLNFLNGFYYMNSDETWLFSLPVQMYQILPIRLNSCSWNKITRYINFCQPYVTITFTTTLCQIPRVIIIPPCHIYIFLKLCKFQTINDTSEPMWVIQTSLCLWFSSACVHAHTHAFRNKF